ncbi:Transcriptional regulator PadR-like family protein [uncultured archaeon]|nr:Transcriptional regulator PadR-like family protein [uncultured archaeon]
MIGLWNIPGKNRKHKGILSLYVLYSLKQKPKSGYEMLSEIMKKSEGWAPSKGTLYPILGQLRKQKLIEISKTGKRSKNTFRLTATGRKVLSGVGKRRKEWRENFLRFRKLFMDVLGEERTELAARVFEIKDTALALPENRKKDVVMLLEKCLSDLKKLEQ